MSTSGTYLSNQREWTHALLPSMASTAGISVRRTTNASRNTPTASVRPTDLMIGSLPARNAMKTPNMISAAAVTTRAVSPTPSRTACLASLVSLLYSSLMRDTTKTW